MPVISVKVSSVIVGDRARKDMGDIAGMAASIEELGLLQPIGITPENVLIFGERRLRAAEMLGWKTIPAQVLNLSSILAGEYAENEIRKGFTLSERVGIGRGMEAELAGRQGQRTDLELPEHFPEVKGRETRELAAEKAGFGNDRTYRQAKQVVDEGAPELVAAVETGKVSVSAAADVATLPKEQQTVIVARGEKEILEAAKAIRADKAETRRQERIEKITEIARGNTDLNISKRYPIIYCDPPWRYEHSISESRAIENQYPTMALEEICALPVADIAFDDCVLFMWATSPKLEESMRVLNAWGFTSKTCAVWDKQKIGMGYYFRQRHELLLVATKGAPTTPAPSERPESVFSFLRGEHSAKPAEVAEMIESMYPDFERVELFCRTPREGWDVWGNQSYAA